MINYLIYLIHQDPNSNPDLSSLPGKDLLYAIRYFIKINIDKFFPKKTRENIIAYAESKSLKTPLEDFNTLREYFNKMESDNQSRVIFIFDHILE